LKWIATAIKQVLIAGRKPERRVNLLRGSKVVDGLCRLRPQRVVRELIREGFNRDRGEQHARPESLEPTVLGGHDLLRIAEGDRVL